MPISGYTGISYPFRVTTKGGCAISTTSFQSAQHIRESIEQIFKTSFLERPMEGGTIYSEVAELLFEPNDEALQNLFRSDIVDAIERLEDRVELGNDDIEFSVETDSDGIEHLYADITYKVIKYSTYYTDKIEVGEIKHE